MTNRNFDEIKDQYIHDALVNAYNALDEKGYNALNQLMDYIYTDDPTYITTYKDARKNLEAVDRNELVLHILKDYFNN